MTFEEGLVKEFQKNNIKIFPLAAIEGTVPPFLVYRKTRVDYIRTLDNIANKTNAEYSLVLVCKNYNDLKDKSELIKNILFDICFKNIGDIGPYIENLSVSFGEDSYINETDEYTSIISVEAKY